VSGQRVCIVLLTGLGDVVHGLPVANALKRSGFASHITWVAEPVPSFVLRPHPAVDQVIVFHKKRGLPGVLDLKKALQSQTFDLTLNLNVYFKSVWPTWFSGAARRITFDKKRNHEGIWWFANEQLQPNPRAHTQDMFLEFLDALDLSGEKQRVEWHIEFTPAEQAAQQAFFAPHRDRPIVALVPVSANRKKDWAPECYARLIEALDRDYGARALLVGGSSAHERHIAAIIQRESHVKPLNALADDVRRMMWLVDGADLVIAPDTGPVHVARAREVPVIGLYGATNPWRVGPYRKYEDLWVDRYTDPGTSPNPSSANVKLDRMKLITPDDVLDRVRVAFDRYVGRSGARAFGRSGDEERGA
jgi:heptosyltransferase I